MTEKVTASSWQGTAMPLFSPTLRECMNEHCSFCFVGLISISWLQQNIYFFKLPLLMKINQHLRHTKTSSPDMIMKWKYFCSSYCVFDMISYQHSTRKPDSFQQTPTNIFWIGLQYTSTQHFQTRAILNSCSHIVSDNPSNISTLHTFHPHPWCA